MEEKIRTNDGMQLGSIKLKAFFLKHLNIIYSMKAHLLEKLPQLSAEVHFRDLYHAVDETTTDIEMQMARMEMIFELFDSKILEKKGLENVNLIDDAFGSIKEYDGEPELQDLAILFYLQNIESIEMSSFQVLQMAAAKLKTKQVAQLLKENYDEAKADRNLILLIAAKYMTAD